MIISNAGFIIAASYDVHLSGNSELACPGHQWPRVPVRLVLPLGPSLLVAL